MRIEILKNGEVTNVIVADEAFAEAVYPGAWRVAAQAPVQTMIEPFAVVITGITISPEHADKAQIEPDFSAMKLPVGAVVTINAQVRMRGIKVPGFNADFAMPMRSTDGQMRYLDVRFNDGATTFSATMNDAKRWEVTRDLINSGLPSAAHMDFAGIVITAVEGA